MKLYRLYQIDSFTRKKFHGNPAGVVPNADGLNDEQMQRIAREMNNSETAFIFKSDSPDYDVEVRFFTPMTEIELCGHATIAAHYVRALEGDVEIGTTTQKTKAGILPVEVIDDGTDFSIMMTQGAPKIDAPLSEAVINKISDALGIDVKDLRDDCPVAFASAGNGVVMVGIKSEEQLHKLKPNFAELLKVSEEIGHEGFYIFTLDKNSEILAHGRVFAPAWGVNEDPVTGMANGPFGAYLAHFGICRELEKNNLLEFKTLQGEAIKRDGGMTIRVELEDGKPKKVQIIGDAVIAFRTVFAL